MLYYEIFDGKFLTYFGGYTTLKVVSHKMR